MNKLIKLNAPVVKTRAEMETLVRDIARLKLNEKLLVAGMDAEIQAVRNNYEGRLNTLAQVAAEKTEAARAWAESHPEEFARRRSVEFLHGAVGFRTGPPKLRTVLKSKAGSVLDGLRAAHWGAAYIRVKEEINREQIIADVGAGSLSATELRKVGAQVVQEESFYVEPKMTKAESRELAKVA